MTNCRTRLLVLVPVISFMFTIISVGIIGTFVDAMWLKNHLPNALPIFIFWIVIVYGLLFLKKIM